MCFSQYLISCAEVTGRWGLLSHTLNAVRWLEVHQNPKYMFTRLVLVKVICTHFDQFHMHTNKHSNTHIPSTVCTFLLSPSQPLPLKVHRRCLHDDGRGVGEPLNETGQFGDGLIIRGKHVVLLDNIENSTIYHRIVAEALMMEPVHGVQPSTDSPSDYVAKYYTNVSQCTVYTFLSVLF